MTPVLEPRRAKAVRLVSLDVDGVLTDGSIWVGADAVGARRELRRFHALDGMGIRLMRRAGLVVAFLSGKRSAAVRIRARELGIEEVSLGAPEGKLAALRGMLARREWSFDQAAHLGDDLADLAVMERVGLPAAVVDAVPEVRAAATWRGRSPAGKGPCGSSRKLCSWRAENGTTWWRSSGKEDGLQFECTMRAGGERRRARGGGAPWIVALASLCAACERDDAPPTAGELLPEGVEMAQTAMRTTVTREGIRRAFVEGDTAEWRGEHEVHLRPMRIFFYNANGIPASEVTSDFGIYNELTGDLDAQGGVVAEDYVDGQRLETEHMKYVNADGRLYGPVPFSLSRAVGTMVIEGTAFESDPGLDSVIVLNPEGETRPRLVTVADIPAEDSAGAPADSAVVQDTAAAPDTTGATRRPRRPIRRDAGHGGRDARPGGDAGFAGRAARHDRGAGHRRRDPRYGHRAGHRRR